PPEPAAPAPPAAVGAPQDPPAPEPLPDGEPPTPPAVPAESAAPAASEPDGPPGSDEKPARPRRRRRSPAAKPEAEVAGPGATQELLGAPFQEREARPGTKPFGRVSPMRTMTTDFATSSSTLGTEVSTCCT